jgi:hypothetical protein
MQLFLRQSPMLVKLLHSVQWTLVQNHVSDYQTLTLCRMMSRTAIYQKPFRYIKYRVSQEFAYLVATSPTASYWYRVCHWWWNTFPEYVLPSSLPDPPGAPRPAARPPPLLVPAEALRRNVGLWERQLDNTLLFGHSMPSKEELAFRRSYLHWCAAAALVGPVCR